MNAGWRASRQVDRTGAQPGPGCKTGPERRRSEPAAKTVWSPAGHRTANCSAAAAKSVQEAFDIQTGYAKSAVEGYLAEFTRWSDLAAASMQRSIKPINDRVAAAAEQFAVR